MLKKLPPRDDRSVANALLDLPDSSVLDVLDHVLTKGVMATGDVTLGVAGRLPLAGDSGHRGGPLLGIVLAGTWLLASVGRMALLGWQAASRGVARWAR